MDRLVCSLDGRFHRSHLGDPSGHQEQCLVAKRLLKPLTDVIHGAPVLRVWASGCRSKVEPVEDRICARIRDLDLVRSEIGWDVYVGQALFEQIVHRRPDPQPVILALLDLLVNGIGL